MLIYLKITKNIKNGICIARRIVTQLDLLMILIYCYNQITKYEVVDQKENEKQENGVSFQSW